MEDEQLPNVVDPQRGQDPRRGLPSVDRILVSPSLQPLIADHGRSLVTDERELL